MSLRMIALYFVTYEINDLLAALDWRLLYRKSPIRKLIQLLVENHILGLESVIWVDYRNIYCLALLSRSYLGVDRKFVHIPHFFRLLK